MTPILSVKHLTVRYPLARGQSLTAVKDVSLTLQRGETLAIVGESGCGKSTLARAICGLTGSSKGEIQLEGGTDTSKGKAKLHSIGRHIQYIFQDPLDALNPHMTIGTILQEPLKNLYPAMTTAERQQRIMQAIDDVALSPEHLSRYPHEFSGGQAQRIGIARALVSEPEILLCDEPVSALDVSIQAQIINLLQRLQQQRQLAMLFISHDLRVVRHLADRVMVLYLGRVMEIASAVTLFNKPRHPYTRALLDAIPLSDPRQEQQRLKTTTPLRGDLPSPIAPPSGCVFRSRCPIADNDCAQKAPPAEEKEDGHLVYCPKAAGIGSNQQES